MTRPATTSPAPAAAYLLLGVTAGGLSALFAAGPPQGGIVPTEYHAVKVAPGPEPDLTFFATGETIGKIEPCG